ncbi:MAG: cytochrome c [Bdellovibrionota bacterium]
MIFVGALLAFSCGLGTSFGEQPPEEKKQGVPFPAITAEAFARGAKLFRKKTCNGCHAFGEFFGKCPDLKDVTQRHDAGWLRRWLKNPDEMRKTDPVAAKLSEEYAETMPVLDLTDEQIEDLLVYLLREGKPLDLVK